MYKPFSKVVPPAKPNSFECAVWKYATCPLEGPIPEPQTRVEQIARAFVFDEKTAADIRKFKAGENSPAEASSSDGEEPSSADVVNLPVDVAGPTGGKLANLPRLTKLSALPEVCEFFHKLTQDEDFAVVPGTGEGIKKLMDKLPVPPFSELYSRLVKENSKVASQYKLATTRLGDSYKEFQTKECEQQGRQGLSEIAAFGRTTTVNEDIASELRPKELPSAVDYINNKVKQTDDEIWEQRYKILIGTDREKIERLQKEVHNRTDRELEELQKYFEKATISTLASQVHGAMMEELKERARQAKRR